MSDESVVRQLERVNTTADVLRRAREMVDTPEKWARCASSGGPWCAGLAIYYANDKNSDEGHPAYKLFERAIGVTGVPAVFFWNDTPDRTHPEVLAAFDRAIELAERGA